MTRRPNDAEHGDKHPIGRRLIDALALKDVSVRGHTLRMEGAHRSQWLTAWMEEREREFGPLVGHLHGPLLAEESIPDGLRKVLEQAVGPTHDVDLFLDIILFVVGSVVQIGALTAPLVQNNVNELWARHTDRPLSPEELATSVVKGQREFGAAYSEAAKSGISEPDFETLVDSTGNPPGPMDLLTMWRRKIIDTPRLIEGLKQSRLKLEWASELERYAYGPPSAAQAILGAVQNHLDDATARSIVAQNGIDPDNYDWLFQNAGRPPGVMQMFDAYHRGAVSLDVVDQAIRESDIKNKYVPVYHSIGEHLLPQKTVVAGVHQGVIPDDAALAMLLKLGISATNAGYLIQEGHNTKTATHRTLSVSQIETAYEDGSLERGAAHERIVGLGYLAADADFILDLVDVKWQQALHNATVTRIRSLYLGHHLDKAAASSALDAAAVTPAHRDLYLHLWDVVRTTPTRTLTEAQVASAYKKELITETQFRTRLAAMGYAAVDVDLLVELSPIPPPAPAHR